LVARGTKVWFAEEQIGFAWFQEEQSKLDLAPLETKPKLLLLKPNRLGLLLKKQTGF